MKVYILENSLSAEDGWYIEWVFSSFDAAQAAADGMYGATRVTEHEVEGA